MTFCQLCYNTTQTVSNLQPLFYMSIGLSTVSVLFINLTSPRRFASLSQKCTHLIVDYAFIISSSEKLWHAAASQQKTSKHIIGFPWLKACLVAQSRLAEKASSHCAAFKQASSVRLVGSLSLRPLLGAAIARCRSCSKAISGRGRQFTWLCCRTTVYAWCLTGRSASQIVHTCSTGGYASPGTSGESLGRPGFATPQSHPPIACIASFNCRVL